MERVFKWGAIVVCSRGGLIGQGVFKWGAIVVCSRGGLIGQGSSSGEQ